MFSGSNNAYIYIYRNIQYSLIRLIVIIEKLIFNLIIMFVVRTLIMGLAST